MNVTKRNIGVLGAGTWGMALARMLCVSGNDVQVWSAIEKEIDSLSSTRVHPNLPGMKVPDELRFTKSIEEVCKDKDVLLNMDRHTVVLIKEMTDVETIDDLHQFAQALQETLMGETAHQMTVGIDKMRRTIDELRDSYNEARRAIEVGRIFKPEESIYIYSRLILERFLMELPQDISAYYHGLLFNRKNQRLFNEEMLYTIEMFFKKDLNLSDTARQLYIHRNTLVYRLDKVQRQTGLDLRSFDDAITFKILMELKKVNGDKAPRK